MVYKLETPVVLKDREHWIVRQVIFLVPDSGGMLAGFAFAFGVNDHSFNEIYHLPERHPLVPGDEYQKMFGAIDGKIKKSLSLNARGGVIFVFAKKGDDTTILGYCRYSVHSQTPIIIKITPDNQSAGKISVAETDPSLNADKSFNINLGAEGGPSVFKGQVGVNLGERRGAQGRVRTVTSETPQATKLLVQQIAYPHSSAQKGAKAPHPALSNCR